MSLATIHSRAQDGVAAPTVTVEVHLSGGLPGTTIVGLPETAVREARDRVRVAIQNAQIEYPSRRVTVWRQLTCRKTAAEVLRASSNDVFSTQAG